MTVLLKDALMPNLVQTLENNPVFIHGGPFANIAHGCNSVLATKTALKLADYVVTEAGFGADLGAEKFFDIKCRKAGLAPDVAVIVATVRALKMHGGVAKENLKNENVVAVNKGCDNLKRHLENMAKFGVPVVVAINRFITDTDAEMQEVMKAAESLGAQAPSCARTGPTAARARSSLPVMSSSWRIGTRSLQAALSRRHDAARQGQDHRHRDLPRLRHRLRCLRRNAFKDLEAGGFGHLPVCMAKTQYSFSTDPNKRGAPTGHVVPVRELRLSAGAEFVVVITGEIMTMPGLPRVPAAESIRLNADGQIEGLF